jgi:hypothetical protein
MERCLREARTGKNYVTRNINGYGVGNADVSVSDY